MPAIVEHSRLMGDEIMVCCGGFVIALGLSAFFGNCFLRLFCYCHGFASVR